jgi:hypothetical protein
MLELYILYYLLTLWYAQYNLRMRIYDWNVGFMTLGAKHTLSRHVLLLGMASQKVSIYRSHHEKSVCMLLNDLIAAPTDFARHLRKRVN